MNITKRLQVTWWWEDLLTGWYSANNGVSRTIGFSCLNVSLLHGTSWRFRWYTIQLHTVKFFRTLRLVGCILMARTFGKYVHGMHTEDGGFVVYDWHGKRWIIPIEPEDVP